VSHCRPIIDFARLGSNSKRGAVVVLAVMLLFLSIALFSPLHRHVPGKAGCCSFNNLEHQWYALLEFAAIILVLLDIGLREIREDREIVLTRAMRMRRGRAPPFSR
jgi:hypothetical protein